MENNAWEIRQRKQLSDLFRACIEFEDARRKHPQAYKSSPPHGQDGDGYKILCRAARNADAEFWSATDFEYSEDGLRDVIWNWRYWKVIVRKCCWSQRNGSTKWAGNAMASLQEAETKMVEVLGLSDIYRTGHSYLEEAFPNLKGESSVR